jgi:hypothetical protein
MSKVRARSVAPSSNLRNLPAATRADLSARALRIKQVLKHSLTEVGRELTEAKEQLSHGQFVQWVEREVGVSARTAQLVMSSFRLLAKNESFSHLSRSALYLLAAPDAPKQLVNRVERMVKAGEVPTYTAIRSMSQEVKKINVVNLAIVMERPDKADIVDLHVHRVLTHTHKLLAQGEADMAARREEMEAFRDRIDVADIACMLSGVLDPHHVWRLTTMIRKAPEDLTLNMLADALAAI